MAPPEATSTPKAPFPGNPNRAPSGTRLYAHTVRHRRGAYWKVAQTNNLPGEDGIKSISVAPAGSSWAGGYQTVKGKEVPLVQHLTSKGWTTVWAGSIEFPEGDPDDATGNGLYLRTG
jgi:hypothetical protein